VFGDGAFVSSPLMVMNPPFFLHSEERRTQRFSPDFFLQKEAKGRLSIYFLIQGRPSFFFRPPTFFPPYVDRIGMILGRENSRPFLPFLPKVSSSGGAR